MIKSIQDPKKYIFPKIAPRIKFKGIRRSSTVEKINTIKKSNQSLRFVFKKSSINEPNITNINNRVIGIENNPEKEVIPFPIELNKIKK